MVSTPLIDDHHFSLWNRNLNTLVGDSGNARLGTVPGRALPARSTTPCRTARNV
jgi:hypothetical protein